MEQATSSQATETAATQNPTPEPASIENVVDASADSEAQSVTTFEPLFDTETISDEDLMGEDAEKPSEDAEKPKDESKAEEKPSETKEAGTSPPKDEKAAEDASDGTGEAQKPPKGFVPIQALHQERGQRQVLTQEVSQLRAELEAFKSGKKAVEDPTAEPEVEDFKVLSEQEFDSLLEEDPVEAIKYDRKLRAWEFEQAKKSEAEKAEKAEIDTSIGMMAEAVPGLYDQDSDINQRLSEFAVENGFADLDGLAVVTDPRTKVIPANGGAPKPLGRVAANLVVMLNSLFQQASKPAVAEGDAKAKDALEKKVREQVTKDVLSKIKQPAGAEHRSLGDIPGDAGSDISSLTNPLTEADFARLSKADQQRLLGG
jgi:hypothetical protein